MEMRLGVCTDCDPGDSKLLKRIAYPEGYTLEEINWDILGEIIRNDSKDFFLSISSTTGRLIATALSSVEKIRRYSEDTFIVFFRERAALHKEFPSGAIYLLRREILTVLGS